MNHNKPAITALAFDIGLSRTGVAVGNSYSAHAQTAGQLTVKNGQHDWQALGKLIGEWQPKVIVIGLPIDHASNTEPNLKKAINRFKSTIQKEHKLPIVEINETLTSDAANAELKHQKNKQRLRDQVAACLILESYFNEAE